MPTMITRMITLLSGAYVGSDESGNRYYQKRRNTGPGRRKRWVVYAGDDEASQVPAPWNGWLHYTVSEPPLDNVKASCEIGLAPASAIWYPEIETE